MQISAFSDYALRILMYLAVSGDRQVTSREIAETYALSFDHLAKVAQFLAREGFVTSVRGRNGGLRLSRPPEDISIGSVLRKAEAGSGLVECMREGPSHCILVPQCGLKPILSEAQDAFYEVLDQHMLSDAVPRRRALQKKLGLPELES